MVTCLHCGKEDTDDTFEMFGIDWLCQDCHDKYHDTLDFTDWYNDYQARINAQRIRQILGD